MPKEKYEIPHRVRCKIAVFADCCEITVRRYIAGTHQTIPPVARAIEDAARQLGVTLPERVRR